MPAYRYTWHPSTMRARTLPTLAPPDPPTRTLPTRRGRARRGYWLWVSGMRQVIRKRSDGDWPGRPTGIMLFTR